MPLGFTTKSIDFTNPVNATRALGLNLSGLVAKASLVNMDTNETYKFMYNPTELKSRVVPFWAKQEVMFRSHPRWQYKSTDAKEWKFQLYLHANSSGAQGLINIIPLSKNINKDLAFLESLCYPIAGKGLAKRRPPRVRFVWPQLANVPVIITEVGATYKKFNFRLQQQITMVDVFMMEDPDKNITSNDVRLRGSTGRPGLLGAVLDLLPSGIGNASETIGNTV